MNHYQAKKFTLNARVMMNNKNSRGILGKFVLHFATFFHGTANTIDLFDSFNRGFFLKKFPSKSQTSYVRQKERHRDVHLYTHTVLDSLVHSFKTACSPQLSTSASKLLLWQLSARRTRQKWRLWSDFFETALPEMWTICLYGSWENLRSVRKKCVPTDT